MKTMRGRKIDSRMKDRTMEETIEIAENDGVKGWKFGWLVGWLVGFLTSSSTTRLYRGRAPRQSI